MMLIRDFHILETIIRSRTFNKFMEAILFRKHYQMKCKHKLLWFLLVMFCFLLSLQNPLERELNVSRNVTLEELERLRSEITHARYRLEEDTEHIVSRSFFCGFVCVFVYVRVRVFGCSAAVTAHPRPFLEQLLRSSGPDKVLMVCGPVELALTDVLALEFSQRRGGG